MFRVRAKINSQSWRTDLDQIWLRRLSEATGIATLFRGFRDCGAAEDDLKMACENVKLFLREPLGRDVCDTLHLVNGHGFFDILEIVKPYEFAIVRLVQIFLCF